MATATEFVHVAFFGSLTLYFDEPAPDTVRMSLTQARRVWGARPSPTMRLTEEDAEPSRPGSRTAGSAD